MSTDTKIDYQLLRNLISFKESPAEIAQFLNKGRTEQDLHPITKLLNSDGENDDNTSLSSKEEDVDKHRYEIDQIFSLVIPPKAGAQHNNTSFGTNVTGDITVNSLNSDKSTGSQSTISTTNMASKAFNNLSFTNNMADNNSTNGTINNNQENTQMDSNESSSSNGSNNNMNKDQNSSAAQRTVSDLTNEKSTRNNPN